MKHVSHTPPQNQAAPSQTMGPASGQPASAIPADQDRDMVQARHDGRYWTRLHHYMSLHSGDGFQMAKHHALRDPAQRCMAQVSATSAAWARRREDYAHFAALRDAALAQIDKALQDVGLPYEKLFDPPDFARIGSSKQCSPRDRISTSDTSHAR